MIGYYILEYSTDIELILHTYVYVYGTYKLLFDPVIERPKLRSKYIYPRSDKRISQLAYLPPNLQHKVFMYLSRKDLDNCKNILEYWKFVINSSGKTLRRYSRRERRELKIWRLLARLYYAARICGDMIGFLFLLLVYHVPFLLNYPVICSFFCVQIICGHWVTYELLIENSEMDKYLHKLVRNENYPEIFTGFLFYWFNSYISTIVNFYVFARMARFSSLMLLPFSFCLLISSLVLSYRKVGCFY